MLWNKIADNITPSQSVNYFLLSFKTYIIGMSYHMHFIWPLV